MTALAPLLLVALPLGLDSLRASAALAAAGLVDARPARLALAFGLCDAAAALAGLAASRSLLERLGGALDHLGPIVLAGCAVSIVLADRCRARAGSDRWAIVGGVPLSLSLDNLLAGAALGVYGVPVLASAVVLGATSALLALAGLAAGRMVRRRLTVRMELAGAALLLLAAVSLVTEPF